VRGLSFWGKTTMRAKFAKRLNGDSYLTIDILFDVKAEMWTELPISKKHREPQIKKNIEDFIVHSLKKKYVQVSGCPLVDEEFSKSRALERLSVAREFLAEIEIHLQSLRLDGSEDDKRTFQSLLSDKIRKLKEKIEFIEMQTREIVPE
jgi:hypothetical protein